MDGVQDITVAHDLLLITVMRRGFILYQLFQTCICCPNALNFIGRFRALYFCNLDQTI